jgi:hypothetical protein
MFTNPETGFLQGYTHMLHCFDFASGGPVGGSGTLCNEFNPFCTIQLRDEHYQSTEAAISICQSGDACRPMLMEFGYSQDEATNLCPNRTLNDQLCKSYVGDPLQQACSNINTGDEEDQQEYQLLPDCSNVEACATPTCQLQLRENLTQDSLTFPVYPTCMDGIETVPVESPPSSQILSCQDSVGTEAAFDTCIYGSVDDDTMIRECRECLVRASLGENFRREPKNCSDYAEETCAIFVSCAATCGSCVAEAYNLLSCNAGTNIEELEGCNLNCELPPPELVAQPTTSSSKNGSSGVSWRTWSHGQKPLVAVVAAVTVAVWAV